MSEIECNILLSKNRTLFNIDIGWEGLPFNIISSTSICVILFVILAIIRWRNDRTKDDPKKNRDFLHFIFDERKANDLKAAKFRLINRKHRLAYLPPILHNYEHLITDKFEITTGGDDFADSFYRHMSSEDNSRNLSFEEIPTLRSDLDFDELTESKINEIYSGFGIKEFNSKEEEEEVKKLKSELFDNYFSEKEIEKEKLKEPKRTEISSTFETIFNYLLIKDEEIIKNKGSDAFQYLLFQRYLIYFLIFLTIICLTIILPVNKQGNSEPNIKKFSQTTTSNLGKGSNLFWVHSLLTLVTLTVGVYIMSHFSKLNRSETQAIDRKILLIQNIPESKRKTSFLIKYFGDNFPNVVIKRIVFLYDSRKLEKMKNQLLTAIEAKKYCFQYRLLYQQRCEVRPYCMGRFGGLFCCCNCCPKLDGVLYYAEEKAELEKEIEEEANSCLSNPIGSAFVVFDTKSMAKEVFQSFNSKAFVLMVWYKSIKSIFTSDDFCRWRVYYAPFPEDIEWRDIILDHNCQRLWSILMHTILLFLFLFLSTPSMAVEMILTFTQRSTELNTLSQFLRPYLLMAMTTILPSIVLIVQYQIPYTTRSALNHELMSKSYIFLIFMVLILPPLNHWTAAVLLDTVLTSNSTENRVDWNCLFPSGNSGFFTNYILSTALVGNIFEILRVSQLFNYIIYLLFISRSVAEYESARQKVGFSFPFGTKYAKLLLMFTIIITYSISSPLVAPAGLLYLVIKHLVDRYNLYYVYNPTQINYRMHSTAVLFVHISLLFLLIQVSTTLSQYEDNDSVLNPSTPILFALFIFFLMIIFKCFRYISDSD